MNNSAIVTHSLPSRVDRKGASRARRIGRPMFAFVVAALEAWLRVPVRPVLEAYLQTALLRALSIGSAFIRNQSSSTQFQGEQPCPK